MTVRIRPALANSISKTETCEKTLLISAWNRPFAVNRFSNWFRDRCDEAGVPGSAHSRRNPARRDRSYGKRTHGNVRLDDITGGGKVHEGGGEEKAWT